MIVFSNTTPLIALSAIEQLDLLPQLFYKIYVVDTVVKECAKGGKIIVPDLTKLEWLHCVENQHYIHNPILIALDDGEKHTIEAALAYQADYTIIDEKLGRTIAEYLRFKNYRNVGSFTKSKTTRFNTIFYYLCSGNATTWIKI